MKKSKKSKIKNIFLGALAVLAVIGVGAFAVQAIPTTNQSTTIKPSGPSDVGGTIDYTKNLELTRHTFASSENDTFLEIGKSFSGKLTELLSLGDVYGTIANYTTNAELATAETINQDFSAGFDTERLFYSGYATVDDDTTRNFEYVDVNTYSTPFAVNNINYYWNGEKVTLNDISAMNYGSWLSIFQTGVVNYETHTVDVNYVIIAIDYISTYQSADGSVVLHFGNTNGSSYLSDNAILAGSHLSVYEMLGNNGFFNEETGEHEQWFGFNVGYSTDGGPWTTLAIEMIDYNTFEYNGMTLTKTA